MYIYRSWSILHQGWNSDPTPNNALYGVHGPRDQQVPPNMRSLRTWRGMVQRLGVVVFDHDSRSYENLQKFKSELLQKRHSYAHFRVGQLLMQLEFLQIWRNAFQWHIVIGSDCCKSRTDSRCNIRVAELRK